MAATATEADTDTPVDIDIRGLSAPLDFDQVCETRLGINIFKWWLTVKRCKNPAEWVAMSPCCGRHYLFCDKHRVEGGFICPICLTEHVDMLGWMTI